MELNFGKLGKDPPQTSSPPAHWFPCLTPAHRLGRRWSFAWLCMCYRSIDAKQFSASVTPTRLILKRNKEEQWAKTCKITWSYWEDFYVYMGMQTTSRHTVAQILPYWPKGTLKPSDPEQYRLRRCRTWWYFKAPEMRITAMVGGRRGLWFIDLEFFLLSQRSML